MVDGVYQHVVGLLISMGNKGIASKIFLKIKRIGQSLHEKAFIGNVLSLAFYSINWWLNCNQWKETIPIN